MIPTIALDQLARVAEEADRLVAAVRPDQWDAPTPCTGWDVRTLVTHLAAGTRDLAAALRGEPSDHGEDDPDAAADPAVDPAAAHRTSVERLLAAAASPGALERTVTIPFGTVPAPLALHLRLTELLVHGWDLSRAAGLRPRFPDTAAEQELAFSREALTQLPPERRPFAPPRSAPDGAPALDRLAALLGRDVAPARPARPEGRG